MDALAKTVQPRATPRDEGTSASKSSNVPLSSDVTGPAAPLSVVGCRTLANGNSAASAATGAAGSQAVSDAKPNVCSSDNPLVRAVSYAPKPWTTGVVPAAETPGAAEALDSKSNQCSADNPLARPVACALTRGAASDAATAVADAAPAAPFDPKSNACSPENPFARPVSYAPSRAVRAAAPAAAAAADELDSKSNQCSADNPLARPVAYAPKRAAQPERGSF